MHHHQPNKRNEIRFRQGNRLSRSSCNYREHTSVFGAAEEPGDDCTVDDAIIHGQDVRRLCHRRHAYCLLQTSEKRRQQQMPPFLFIQASLLNTSTASRIRSQPSKPRAGDEIQPNLEETRWPRRLQLPSQMPKPDIFLFEFAGGSTWILYYLFQMAQIYKMIMMMMMRPSPSPLASSSTHNMITFNIGD